MDFVELLVFAMLAVFLVFRLRSVLGRRTGHERPPVDPFTPGSGQPDERMRADDEKVVALPDHSQPEAAAESAISPADTGNTVSAGLSQIQIADAGFDADVFLDGARGAFEMIITSFANGDTDTLSPLLSDEVFDNFSRAIEDRVDRKQTLETTLVGVRETEVIEASMDGRIAFLVVKFVTDQINVTRDANGEGVDGDAGLVTSVTDIWTFARNTRARNPNWTLVATDAPN